MTPPRRACIGVAVVWLLASFSVSAQGRATIAEPLKDVFTEENRPRLCNADNRVRASVLLGELGTAYQINLFALPDAPKQHDDLGKPIAPPAGKATSPTYTEPVAQRAAYWIVVAGKIASGKEAARFGIKAEHEPLTKLNNALVGFAHHLEREQGIYRLPAHVDFGRENNLADRARVVALMVDPPAADGAEPVAAILCSTDSADGSSREFEEKVASGLVFAVRGTIDDLATPRESGEDFKKASEAKASYTMNGVKGEESVSANVAVGAGWVISEQDAVLGFARYTESSTETQTVGDDDDSKDIRAYSAGLMYAHALQVGVLNVQTGITAYKTWDQAQDSRLIRTRAFADDISLVFGSGSIICGRASTWGTLQYSCKAGLFAEKGRVLAAGRSMDFADTRDDNYAGLGTDLALSFWINTEEPLSNWVLTTQYRRMWVLDGDLNDPDRFLVELSYKFPNTDVSLGLSRTYGENFDTFQKEEVNLLSIGFKF